MCVRRGRAPKGKGAAAPEEAADPNERVTPPAFSEESLAALSFDAAEPYTDPDPQILPSSLEAVVTSWQRPSEYLQALVEEGGEPYVVLPPVVAEVEEGAEPAPVSRELPNLIESVPHIADGEGAAVAEARRALQWMISCIQLVALHPGQVDEGCFLWELIHPQTNGRPRHVPSGKYAVKLFDQGAWRLVTVDDRIPFDAAGVAMLPRTVSRSPCRLPPTCPSTCPLPPTPRLPLASICTTFPSALPSRLHPSSALPPARTLLVFGSQLPEYQNGEKRPRRANVAPPLDYRRLMPSRLPRCRRRPSSCGLCCSPRPSTSCMPARHRASHRTRRCSCG